MGLKRTAQDITVGTQLGPVTVEITAERVQAYAAAVQDTTLWYSHAFAVPIVPPAFIAILSGMPLDATCENGRAWRRRTRPVESCAYSTVAPPCRVRTTVARRASA